MDSTGRETEFDFLKMVNNAQKECIDIKNKLEEKVNSINKLEILSRISLLTQTRTEGVSYSEYYGTLSDTACVPFIIGLSLKSRAISEQEPTFQEIDDILNLLYSYFIKYGLSLHPILKNSVGQDEDIIHSARIHGLIGQTNPEKYPFQILELLRETFGHFNDFFKKQYGFTIEDAIRFGQLIEDNYVNNLNQRKRTVQKTEFQDDEKNRIFYSKIREILEISPEKFCEDNHIADTETFGKYLSTLSCHFGEGNEKYESPLDNNIIFNKPLICHKGKFYSFIPIDLFQKLPSIFEDLLYNEKIANSKNWQKYREIKSNYTENKVHDCISKIFPERDIFKNLYYEYNGATFEVDHIIQYCNNVIIIESKSGNFSLSAKRGGLERIKTDLKRLVCDAHSQALRVKDYIKSRKKSEFQDSNKKIVLEIDFKENTNFILINVTLEPLHSFSSNLKRLENLGLFSKYDYPWSVSLFELEIISKFLNSPAIFIHYIERRLDAQEQNNISTYDELSFLGLYLGRGNFDFSTKNGKKIDMISLDPEFLSDFDDHYLLGKEAPQLKIEKEIKTIINELENLRPNNFTKMTNTLLDLNHESRTNFIKFLKKIISDTQIDGKRHDFSFVVEPKKIGITVFSQVGRENLLNHLASFCELKKYQIKSDSWIGFGIDILDSDYFVNEYFFDEEKWRKDPKKEKFLKYAYDKKLLGLRPNIILKQ